MMKKRFYCLFVASLLLMNSCLGASADMVMRANGSGKITLEYRVSQMLESIGRLDGNERWPALPVGRTDFERSVARIPGLRLSSYKSREAANASGGSDLVTTVTLEFKEPAALLAFWDSTGSHASLIQGDTGTSSTALRLVLLDPSADVIDPDLLSLLREVSAGYEISLSFTAPKNAALSVTPSAPAARIVPQGKKVSFAIAMGELAGLKDGLIIEIRW
jgi:hypothetical protein